MENSLNGELKYGVYTHRKNHTPEKGKKQPKKFFKNIFRNLNFS
jgi:hypothetical protein